jgi:hypothetical protein
MKIGRLLSAACAVCAAAVLFCSFAHRPPDMVTGHVHMYGNMPFSFPGFETEDGKRYTLVLDEKKSGTITLKELQSLQGQRVELSGVIHAGRDAEKAGINRLHDGEFVVYSYRILGNQ